MLGFYGSSPLYFRLAKPRLTEARSKRPHQISGFCVVAPRIKIFYTLHLNHHASILDIRR